MNVPIEDAYREACLALGEAIVRERLLVAELSRRELAASARESSPSETGVEPG